MELKSAGSSFNSIRLLELGVFILSLAGVRDVGAGRLSASIRIACVCQAFRLVFGYVLGIKEEWFNWILRDNWFEWIRNPPDLLPFEIQLNLIFLGEVLFTFCIMLSRVYNYGLSEIW